MNVCFHCGAEEKEGPTPVLLRLIGNQEKQEFAIELVNNSHDNKYSNDDSVTPHHAWENIRKR